MYYNPTNDGDISSSEEEFFTMLLELVINESKMA